MKNSHLKNDLHLTPVTGYTYVLIILCLTSMPAWTLITVYNKLSKICFVSLKSVGMNCIFKKKWTDVSLILNIKNIFSIEKMHDYDWSLVYYLLLIHTFGRNIFSCTKLVNIWHNNSCKIWVYFFKKIKIIKKINEGKNFWIFSHFIFF